MTAKRAGFKRGFRLSISSLLSLVLIVSTLSAISVPFANAATVTATGTNPSVCNQEVGNSTNVESSRVGNKCVVEFKNIGTTTWQVPTGITSAQVMVVAGGGSGGGLEWTGGGGAGGVITASAYSVTAGSNYTVVVGAGGASQTEGNTPGNDGGNSSFDGKVARGGGGGAGYGWNTSYTATGRDGGSGGGSGEDGSASAPGSIPTGGASTQDIPAGFNTKYGNKGGDSGNLSGQQAGGGGGGAGAAGGNVASNSSPSNRQPGNGGDGVSLSIGGKTFNVAAGGGGASFGTKGVGGSAGGVKIGGDGGRGDDVVASRSTPGAGASNTGSGGGGTMSSVSGSSGAGGSGIVVVAYDFQPSAPTITSITGENNSLSVAFTAPTNGANITGYKYSTNGGSTWSASTGSSSSPISIPSLTNGTSYAVQIRAVNGSADGVATATTNAIAGTSCSPTTNPSPPAGYTVLTFTSTTSCNWSIPSGVTAADVLIVGGGGAGGGGIGGGGGAGEFIETTRTGLTGGSSVLISVGAGGTSNNNWNAGNAGGQSQFASVIAYGGGGGGTNQSNLPVASGGPNFGSQGGGGYNTSALTVGTRSDGFRNNGGAGSLGEGSNATGGGGGGAGGAGASGTTTNAGNGGLGKASSITGSSLFYAAGGGGGVNGASSPGFTSSIAAGNPGNGGSSIGGNGGSKATTNTDNQYGNRGDGSGSTVNSNGRPGVANTGSGGGGASNWVSGGAGGSGVVIVKYVNAPSMTLSTSTISASVGTAIANLTVTNTGGSATYSISPSLPSGLNINSSTGVVSGTPSSTTSSTNYTITATNTSGTSTATFTYSAIASQTITRTSTSPVSPVVAGTYTPTATASSGLTVAITIASGSSSICSISGGIVTFNAAGSCVIQYNQAGNASYTAATQITETLTIGKGSQTITFGSLSNRTLGSGTYSISASSSSSLTVAFTTATASICTVASTTITLVAAGTCTINANQAGDSNYLAATQVQQSFTVATAITITTPTTGLSGTFNTAYSLTVSASGGSGSKTFAATGSLPAGVTISSGGVISGTPSTAGDFDLTVTATDANNATATTSSFRISIAKGVSSISLSVGTYTYTGSGLGPDSVTTSGSQGSVTYAYAGRGSTSYTSSPTKPTAVGTYTVTATLAADSNYASVSASANFEITNAGLVITPTISASSMAYGTSVGSLPTISHTKNPNITLDTNPTCALYLASDTGFVTPQTLGATLAAGSYVVRCAGAAATNYTITYGTNPSFTVTRIDITLTVGNPASTPYTGSSVSVTNTFTRTSGTLAGSDAISGMTYTYTSAGGYNSTTAPTAGGNYTITGSNATFSTGSASNYTITYVAGALTITAATQTVTWAPNTNLLTTDSPATPSALATALGSATISYAVTSAGTTGCTVNSSTAVLTFTAAGNCQVTATAAATSNYATASTAVTFAISVPTYVITLAAGTNGSGSTQTLTKTRGVDLTLPDSATANGYFTRAGYSVTGWSTTNLGSQTHALGGSFTTEAATTLYPVWTLVSCSPTSSVANGYTIYRFSTVGTCTWTVPNGLTNVQILAVAGGGGGGYSYGNTGAGGGGGGQVKTGTATLGSTLEVTVGAGGSAGTLSAGRGGSGGNSIASSITALGGTGGCGVASPSCSVASAATASAAANGGAANVFVTGTLYRGRGGGGSSGVRGTETGGDGTDSDYSGTSTSYGAGGSGGSKQDSLANIVGSTGTANTGNGGGGGATGTSSDSNSSLGANGGAGGSGVVVVRTGNTLNITYDANGGSAPSGGSATTITGGTVSTLATTSRTGYTFSGWFTASSGGTQITTSAAHTRSANFTLYAQWSANSLTVTYDSQGGSAVTSGSVNTGANISAAPTTPTRAGYTLSGWSTTSTGSVVTFPYTHSQTASFTLYAIWSANTLTVTFNSQEGSAVSNGSVATNATLTAPTPPTRAGYTFSGWSTTSSGSVVSFAGGYTHGQTANFTLYAIWSSNSLTVTFDSQSGSAVSNGSVATNATLTAPTPPTRAGYTFSGWSTTSSGSVVSFASGYTHGQTANFTLYAIWSANALTVTYNSKGGTAVTSGTVNTAASISSAPTPPTRTGYTFSAWSATDGGTAITFPYAHGQTANFTLFALWTAGTNTVIFDANSGSGTMSNQSITSGTSTALTRNTLTKSGYIFGGWNTNADGSSGTSYNDGQSVTITAGATLYARWLQDNYLELFGRGDVPQNTSYQVPTNNVFTAELWWQAPATFPTKTESFSQRTIFSLGDNVSTNLTLFANADHSFTIYMNNSLLGNYSFATDKTSWHHLALVRNGSAITFFYDGQSVLTNANLNSGTVGAGIRLGAYYDGARWGNGKFDQFKLWDVALSQAQLAASANTYNFSSDTPAAEDLILHYDFNDGTGTTVPNRASSANFNLSIVGTSGTTAYSTISPSVYSADNSVTYDGNGSTGGSVPSTQTKLFGTSLTLATNSGNLVRTGYTFNGWNTAANVTGTSYAAAASYTLNTGLTLFARWTANSNSITYDNQSATTAQSGGSTSYTTGSAIATIPTTPPIKTGYTFAGWFTASSGGNQVTNGSLTPASPFGTVTLYAQWTANSLTVTYNSKGGTAVTSGTVNTAASISSAPTPPTRTGYTFSAWSATDGGTAITFPYAHGQTASFTLFAIWTANTLTVTYNSQSGSAVSNGTVATGASISAAPTTPTRTGYTLDGWSATETGTVVVFPYAHGQTANFTLFAKWTGNTNTITYDSKGGSAVANGSFVTGGSIAAAPTTPSRAGYTLAGWSLTDGGSIISYPYSPPGTSGITLYAIWTGVSCSPTSTTTGGYTIYTFTTAGTCFWTVPNGLTDVEVLAVAGGGGGGYAWDNAGAGGGAGGQVKTGTVTLGSILEVTVGAGGTAGIVSSTRGGSGANTVVSTITALGGTGGCAARATTCSNSAQATSSAAANGGIGGAGGASGRGGGGSNTTASATSTTAGGNGTSNSYSGSAVTYGAGGTGGTARGANSNVAGTAGSVNTGNGGSGASAKSSSGEVNGGAGGSGLVVVRIASALTVAFDSQGGSAVSDTSTVTAGILSEPTAPTRSTYTFLGWFTATTGGSAITFPYTHGQTANFTLYARWALNTYAIVFNTNNGSGTMSNQSVTHGVAANLNANLFTRANYVFHRWATAADGTGTTYSNLAQVTLTAGTTLYAQWTANTYVVTYSYNDATGGNSTATSSFTTAGSAIVLPTPTKTGYTFAGWFSDAGLSTSIGSAGANYSPTGTTLSLNAYAKWTAIDYNFTYDGNNSDGGTVPTETSKQIGQTATVKANTGSLNRAGYTFVGWNTQSNGGGTNYLSGALFTVQSSNVTLYAKWSANSYTITYNSNGGTGSAQRSSSNVSTDTYTTGGSSVALPGAGSLERAGYTFDGWNTSAAGSGTNRAAGDTYTTVSDVIFYAKWNAVTYTITYAGNTSDGGTTPTTGGYTTGQASPYLVVANTFTKTSNVFGGWNTAANGTGTSYSPGATITTLTNIVLYATWIPQFTLHYAINGGTVSSGSLPADQLYNTGTSVGPIFSSVSRTGYTFGGWTNGSTTIAGGGNFTILADSVLTAKWTPIDYTISYDSDGGTTPPNSFTKQIGQSFEVGSAVSKPGYNFTGWKAGVTTVGAGATVVTGSSNISYTAQWVARVYRISYDWNGGRGTAVSDVDYTFGTAAITLPLVGDRVKDGYNFAGWAESANGSALGLTYTPSQTRTLYALWTLGNFTVTYDAGRGTVTNSTVAVQNGGSTVLPLPTRANFVFNGWHTAVTGGSSVGSNGASFTPAASQTVYARWIQSSLYGITDSLSRIGSVITTSNVSNTFSGANSNSSVSVSIPANALPAGTTINFDLVGNSSRAVGVLPNVAYLVSIALSWLTGDETVPDTASDKPISVTITNATIKAGAAAYAIVNNVSTLLGTATQDGSITVSITSDPEVVVAATKPTAPLNVAATSNGAQQSVISWSAPSSTGGSAITSYTVTASPGTGTCTTSTTSCTISGLTNGTAYSFTVTATNTVGTSVASTAATATTAALYAVAFDAKSGSTVTSGSFLTASTVTEPTAPTRTGYSFAGWSATDGGSVITFPYAPGVANNITLFARWDALDNAVTFDSKSGSSVTSATFSSGGTVAEPTAPTRTGFTFAGWSATDGGTAVTFPYAPGVVTDITLYAKWTAVSQSSSGSGGSNASPAPADPAPSTGGTPVRSNVTVVAPVVVVGNKDAKILTVEVFMPAAGSTTKPPVIKIDAASEKFIAGLKVVEGKLTLTPETGFSGRKTVTVTITENGTDRIIQIPLTVLPEAVTKPVFTPIASNRSNIRWTASPNADGYTVFSNGKRVCTTTTLNCSVKTILGPDANIEIVSNGGDRTVSQRSAAEFRQNIPVPITRLVSATNTKVTLSRVDTKALDTVVALVRNQGFGTIVISEITTTSKTKALAAARIESIKKYIDDRTGTREITFEIVPPTSRTSFNNISVKG